MALPELIGEVMAVSRQNLGERGGDIIVALEDDLPSIAGDRTQIRQLLHNLVSNSAKYGRPGSPITVRAQAIEPAMVRLEVSDEGEGIPPDHLPRLTERFYRVDSGRSRSLGRNRTRPRDCKAYRRATQGQARYKQCAGQRHRCFRTASSGGA
jgi:two-component system phosphate regulon sensor histidine kinase PhoR